MPLGEAIENAHLMLMSEQKILILKHNILRSLVPLTKHYFVNMEEDDKNIKITRKRCNGFVECSGRSVELIYITFLYSG